MATTNPFDLLGDNENDDLSLLIAAQQKKLTARPPAASTPTAAKLPSKPLPPAQAGVYCLIALKHSVCVLILSSLYLFSPFFSEGGEE